jgi:hypothetical protein
MRRFTRLTNGFSKKRANLVASVALHFAHYNLVRIPQDFADDANDGGECHRPSLNDLRNCWARFQIRTLPGDGSGLAGVGALALAMAYLLARFGVGALLEGLVS